MGGQNCYVDIVFEDGVTWIARFGLRHPRLPPQPVRNHVFLSEVATLKYLEPLRLPTPKVYKYELPSDNNAVGVSYVLMEKLSGSPLDWATATEVQRLRVVEQMADFYLELERHPLTAAGSFFLDAGSIPRVQGYAIPQIFSSPTETQGPFESYDSAIRAIIRQQMDMLTQGEVTALSVDNYLTMLWRLENVHQLLQSTDEQSKFYLKHQDDKGDHILVDAGYNITGIIDWEWCTTGPAPFALSSPCMMWPVGDYYDGKNAQSKEEVAFANAFERGTALIWPVCVEFESLFRGLVQCFSEKDEAEPYLQWKANALTKWENDAGLQELMKKQLCPDDQSTALR